jgi:fatty-acyl-CoA synthase
VIAPWGRSGDDLFFLYTGGTTGLPKGVMWRQDDLFAILNRSATRRYPETGGLDDVRAALDSPGFVHLCACPLMHGTGIVSSISALTQGGSVVTLPSRTFHAEELLDVITRERAQSLAIVGDAFGRPMVDALEAEPERWDLSSLVFIMSSGVRWSDAVKDTLLRHHPDVMLVDTLGSSEALSVGRSVKKSGSDDKQGRFALGPRTRVITEDGRDIEPGSGEIGLVANIGRGPIGYYKDPEKSARTFPVIDGQRATIPATWRPSRPMAPSPCSVAARRASTPRGRRCSPKRSKTRSVHTRRSTTWRWSVCPTPVSASSCARSSKRGRERRSIRRRSSRT